MPNYSKVQFIAWGIYTGPVHGDPRDKAIGYSGIASVPGDRRLDVLGQFLDIKARVAFTELAIDAAYQKADTNANTLKIFVAPEFLYRGAAGAYLYDLLNGWVGNDPFGQDMIPKPYNKNWPGLFGELRELVRDPKYQDWVFIFGSAVGAAFQTSNGKIIMDKDHPVSVWNQSLIQCGGKTEEQHEAYYFTQKHLKSGIDFIKYNLLHPESAVFENKDVGHTSAADRKILDRLMLEEPLPREVGGSLFCFPHICNGDGKKILFGLEICLDHAKAYSNAPKTGVTGRLAIYGEAVNIQLVPSCGMRLKESSLALAPKDGPKTYSYAFNCDGFGSYDPSGRSRYALGGHVQLWGGSTSGAPEQPPRHLREIINSLKDPQGIPVGDSVGLSGFEIPQDARMKLGIDLTHIPAAQLWRSHTPFQAGKNPHNRFWPQGAGLVHVLSPQPLCPASVSDEKLLESIEYNLDALKKHYTFSSVEVTGKRLSEKDPDCNTESTDFSVDFDVELKTMLKYASACQLPHVQGMLRPLGINASSVSGLASALRTEAVRAALTQSVQLRINEIIKRQDDLEGAESLTADAVETAAGNIENFVNELESLYIGRTSTINMSFRAAFSGDGTPLSVKAVAYDGSTYDAALLAPEEDDKMRSNGEVQFRGFTDSAVEMALNRLKSSGTPPEVYHRVRARNYANFWTSNPSKGTKDLTKWNTEENPNVPNPPYIANPNADCANYVSQAIHAGGIPMTSREKSDESHWFASPKGCSLAWENCTALHAYFTQKQYWVSSDIIRCNAGGVIFLKNKSGKRYHVVMCVYNDTVTKAFSAHTHDRCRWKYTGPSSFGVDLEDLEFWVFQNTIAD